MVAREVPTFFKSLSVGQGPADIVVAIVWHAGDVDKLDHIFDNIPRPQGAWSWTFSREVTIHHHPMLYLYTGYSILLLLLRDKQRGLNKIPC